MRISAILTLCCVLGIACISAPEPFKPGDQDTGSADSRGNADVKQEEDLPGALDEKEAVPDTAEEVSSDLVEIIEEVGCDIDCDDGNPCTLDECSAGECVNTPTEGDCDDGDACTLGDLCEEGACKPGPDALDCEDDNVCTEDSCDPVSGCVSVPADGDCDDDDVCTLGDICQEGECQPGLEAMDCQDNNLCTEDSCHPETGCLNKVLEDGTECDDLDACTITDMCVKGECVGGGNLDCNDQNVCTADSCDPFTGCVNAPLTGNPCNDGSLCTLNDSCVEGTCVGGETDPLCSGWCGNCICEYGESPQICPVDCGWCGDSVCGCQEFIDQNCELDCVAVCGNGKCEGGENTQACQVDCHGCGDGFCGLGESFGNCKTDCPPPCGNQICDEGGNGFDKAPENPLGCPTDCKPGCGNGLCEGGENPEECGADCAVCGDDICGIKLESAEDCPQDCMSPCGNGICEGGEHPDTCAVDCGWCGDLVCGLNESYDECPADCYPLCGNKECEGPESAETCPQDCACLPQCDGKDCGDDGCEGVCGVCIETMVCADGICT